MAAPFPVGKCSSLEKVPFVVLPLAGTVLAAAIYTSGKKAMDGMAEEILKIVQY